MSLEDDDEPLWLWRLYEPLIEIKHALRRIATALEQPIVEKHQQFRECVNCGCRLVGAAYRYRVAGDRTVYFDDRCPACGCEPDKEE